MDITPLIAEDRKLIHAYGNGGFKISGKEWRGSVLLFPDQVVQTAYFSTTDITPASLPALFGYDPPVELLLIGCGNSIAPISAELRALLREHHIAVELMDTGAACRTYNVLLAEERRVAAILIAV